MPITISTATMIQQLAGLLHTRDLTLREADFVEALVDALDAKRVGELSERQVHWLQALYQKHFAG